MFESGGFWLPEGEHHFTQYGSELAAYQHRDRDAAYQYVTNWDVVLDVGANVGIFSRAFAEKFAKVIAFEPMPHTFECLALNVPENVQLENVAVADKPGCLDMYRTASSGASFILNHDMVVTPSVKVKPGRTVAVEARTIDSYELPSVGLMKFDIQGAELLALMGARETILRCRPVLMVEEKPLKDMDNSHLKRQDDWLRALGMTPKEKAHADRIYVFG